MDTALAQHPTVSWTDRPRPADEPCDRRDVVLTLSLPPDRYQESDLANVAAAVKELVIALLPAARSSVSLSAHRNDPGSPDAPFQISIGRNAASAGPLELDLTRRTLRVDGAPVSLTRLEYELLAFLVQRPGIALSRAEISSQVWGFAHSAAERTLDVHVRRLRIKLGRHRDRIETVRGHGYRFGEGSSLRLVDREVPP